MPSPERSVYTKIHQQDSALKTIMQQQESVSESNRQILAHLMGNSGSIAELKVELSGIRQALNDLVLTQKGLITSQKEQIASQKELIKTQKEAMESHRELRDAFYEFTNNQLANEYGNDEEEDAYHETGKE